MKKYIAILTILLSINISAQEVLDEIVAIVDNDIILASELQFQVNLWAAQNKVDPSNPDLKNRVLNSLIDEKLLYAQAELDSIVVSNEEIERQLDYQMNYFIQQYGSKENMEQVYGMSLERIKRESREETRKQMMAQKVREQKFGLIDITRREAEEFFTDYKDSLGVIPEKYSLSHIFINPKAGEKVKKKSKEFISSLLDSIKNGADFAELAKKHSDDPGSAALGGDLGTVKRGVFYPEFESAAFALLPGEISKIVETPVGYHIIELLDRRGESIHTRHILIKIKTDDDSDLKAIELLTELRDSILSGKESFAYYARKFSDDKETASRGGELGTFEIGQLDKSLLNHVSKLKKDEISFPKRLELDKNSYGFHIIKLLKRTNEHLPSLDEDYEDIRRLAEYSKKQKLYTKWLEELRDNIYWEIKL